MSLCCHDIHKLVHPYIDGEFSEEERAPFERHVSECTPCRTAVDAEQAFKTVLRKKLALPKPGNDLRSRIGASLDEVDHVTGERPTLLSWLVPSSAMATAAAAIALFFLYPNAHSPAPLAASASEYAASRAPDDVFIDNVASDPIEVPVNELRAEGMSHVGISVQPANLPDAEPSRAWVTQVVRDRRAVRVDYRVRNGDNDETRTLHMFTFDPRGVQIRAKTRERINGIDVLCASGKGMNRVYYMKDGVGVALVSDMPEAKLLDLVRFQLSQLPPR